MKKQSNLITKFEKIVTDHILSDNSLTSAQKQMLLTQSIVYIRSSLSSEKAESQLRGIFERFIGSKAATTMLELPYSNPANTRVNYKIPIYYEDFIGQDITIWGAVGKTIKAMIQQQKFNTIKDINVKSVTNNLAKEIQLVGGYAKILAVPLGAKEGFKANIKREYLLPAVSDPTQEPNAFIIDLRNPGTPVYENSMYVLEHIAFLLHGIPIGFSVEPVGSTFDQHRAYFFVTYQGYLKSSQIYTASGTGRQYVLKYYEKFSDPDNPGNQITFYSNIDEHNQDWNDAFKFKISMTSGGRSQFGTIYMNYLRTSMDPMVVYIGRLLRLR